MKINDFTSKIRTLLFTVTLVCGAMTSGWAATYFVDSVSGNDANTGTETAPWKSLTKVNSTAFKSGDYIYFKCGQTWSAALIPVSGSSAGYVTYGSYGSGVKPVIRNFNATGKMYVKLQGVKLSSTTADYPLYINKSSYIWVENCEIYAESGSTAYAAARIYMDSHHNKIINCVIEHRNLSRQNDALNLKYNANYNLIEGNKIGTATHYALTLEGSSSAYPGYVCSYNIIRKNTINNPEGAVVELQSNANRNVFENNTVTGGKNTSFCANQPRSFKSVSQYNIIRGNVIYDNLESAGSGISSQAYQYNTDPANNVVGNRIYNNVIKGIYANPIVLDNYEPTVCKVSDNVFKNNIISGNGVSNGLQLIVTANSNITDNYFQNNLFYKYGTTNVMKIKGVSHSVASIQSTSSTYFSGNIQKDPAIGVDNNLLSSSPCIDAGGFLTTVTSSSGSGNIISLADAKYFTDGYGVAEGDKIRIGNIVATISSIDYSTNKVILKEQIAWQQGASVSLPFAGTKPDIGAFEFADLSSTLLPPVNLKVVE
jgi:hypothetical protein